MLIFDEVITGFGRLGANFGADRFGVKPDMITFAKGITNGVIPILEPVLEEGLHALKGKSGILDIRNFGLSGAVDLDPIPGKPGLRAMKVLEACIEKGALVRVSGDAIAVGPPFISKSEEVQFLCGVLGEAIDVAMKIK